jgi:hypothetical protein
MSITITHREKRVFYGYLFDGDEYHDNYPDTNAAAERQVAASGLPNPWGARTERLDRARFAAWQVENQAAIDAWTDAVIAAEASLPVGTGTHGSNAVGTPYLYATGTCRDTPRGTARATPELDPIALDGRGIDPVWKTVLDGFLASQEITPPVGANQPGWWSVAFEDRD